MSSVLTELLGAVRYMHASGIAHRDLKPMNLLITEHNSLRVCDLGKEEESVLDTKNALLSMMAIL